MAHVTTFLTKFKDSELKLTTDEAREILIFIFPMEKRAIKEMTINNNVIGFAQGLLVVAIDSSNKLGFAESLFKSAMKPNATVCSILKSFALKAVVTWFKNTKKDDLSKIKIYERVRERLVVNFRTYLNFLIADPDYSSNITTRSIQLVMSGSSKVWCV